MNTCWTGGWRDEEEGGGGERMYNSKKVRNTSSKPPQAAFSAGHLGCVVEAGPLTGSLAPTPTLSCIAVQPTDIPPGVVFLSHGRWLLSPKTPSNLHPERGTLRSHLALIFPCYCLFFLFFPPSLLLCSWLSRAHRVPTDLFPRLVETALVPLSLPRVACVPR